MKVVLIASFLLFVERLDLVSDILVMAEGD